MTEGRPERRGTFSSANPYVHLQTTVLAAVAWGVIQHMLKYVKPCFRCYLPSFFIRCSQGTGGLESPPWIFGALSKCHLAWEQKEMPWRGEDSQRTSKHRCPNPSSTRRPSSPSPSSLGRQIPREHWHPGWPWGWELGPGCVWGSSGSLSPPPRPSTHKREKKSAGKGGRQVLLSGSLVSMVTGSALLQLLTPQSLCHPIFSWKTKERGKVVGVWGGESWETFLGFAERRLIWMQPCLAFNHKLNPRRGGFLWDSSDLMHSQVPYLPRPRSSEQARQPGHPPVSVWSSWAVNLTLPLKRERTRRLFHTWGEKKLSPPTTQHNEVTGVSTPTVF